MTPLEEGTAIQNYMTEHDYTQEAVAEELGRSKQWVSERVSIAMNLSDAVRDALSGAGITLTQALIISQLEEGQEEFLSILLKEEVDQKRKLSKEETRELLHRFQNDTIYTIGYSGKDIKAFIALLKDNKIEQLVDIRESTKSLHRPEFSG